MRLEHNSIDFLNIFVEIEWDSGYAKMIFINNYNINIFNIYSKIYFWYDTVE